MKVQMQLRKQARSQKQQLVLLNQYSQKLQLLAMPKTTMMTNLKQKQRRVQVAQLQPLQLVVAKMVMKMKIHLQLKIQLEQQQVVALADHLPMQTMQNWKRKLQD